MFHTEVAVSEELVTRISMACSKQIFRKPWTVIILKEADLICFAESKVSELISSHRLAISRFTIVSRLDFTAHYLTS